MEKITILTPTYNRAKYLPRLYESLCMQTVKAFRWLVIDDGSTDHTKQWFATLEDAPIEIEYHCKSNGGKHSALNFAHPYLRDELILIVDSDDYLTAQAIETVLSDWEKYQKNPCICGITYLRGEDEKTPLNHVHFPSDGEISDSITRKTNGKKNSDSCEVIRSSVLKEFPFPEYMGEKFLGESYLWNLSGYKYKTVYRNKIIYITEYLDGGLSKSGRTLRIRCPYGGMKNAKTYFNDRVCMKQRIKQTLLFVCYGKFAGLGGRQILMESGQPIYTSIAYPPGYLLYSYWKKRYGEEDR